MEQDSNKLTIRGLIELLKKQLELYPFCETGEVKIATEIDPSGKEMDVFSITDMVLLENGNIVLVNRKAKEEYYSFNTIGKA